MKIETRNSKTETRKQKLEIQTEPAVVNRQTKVEINLGRARGFLRRLLASLDLKGRAVNVGFVDDGEMARLNARFRSQAKATDVLSFPWEDGPDSRFQITDLRGFLGDIVISAETAQRNARAEGHSTENEIRWLMLHGVLHLCGFDHERDDGEMTALELRLRERLRI